MVDGDFPFYSLYPGRLNLLLLKKYYSLYTPTVESPAYFALILWMRKLLVKPQDLNLDFWYFSKSNIQYL